MKRYLEPYLSISDESLRVFMDSSSAKQQAAKTIIFRPGRANRHLLFLEKGLLRAYRLVEGQEYTHYFLVEGWFATDFQSFLTDQASKLYLESLTPVTYLEFEKTVLLQLYQEHHELERLGRVIAEQAYLKTVERLIDFQTLTLKNRYAKLIGQHPHLFQQVPQKMIASYLGVAEQSLSRIKANWSNNS